MDKKEQKKMAEKAWEWFEKNIGYIATPSPYGTVSMLNNSYKEKFFKELGIELPLKKKKVDEETDMNMTWFDL